jgi:HD superfamily phosphodiesterase
MDPSTFDPITHPLDAAWFDRPASIHGISHARRVLIHAQAIATARDVDSDWFESLVLAVSWHDIGRTHDGREPEHGRNSVAKVKSLGLHQGVDPTILARTFFAMEWHSVSDHHGLDAAAALKPGHRPEPGTSVRVLWLLKDADGLDRVRIEDLDPNQLRYGESIKRIDEAWRLLREMP